MAYLLYAEDDFDDQQDLKEMLQAIDPTIKVVLVHTGLALLQYLDTLGPEEEWPFLLVLDMNMPVSDGINTLQILKKSNRYAHIPIIFYSTSTLKGDADLAMEHGAEAFIRKPNRRDEMQGIIDQWSVYCKKFLE